MFIQTLALEKWEPASREGDIAKSPRMLRSSWILNERSLYCKIAKYCFLSKVCMIKTVPITGREDSWSRVGHALRPIFMLWLVKIWQVSSCGKFMQHLKSCLLWQLKLTEFCVDLGSFYLSFSTGCTKYYLAAIRSLLLFIASLLIGVLVEKFVTWQSRKSDFGYGIVFVFTPSLTKSSTILNVFLSYFWKLFLTCFVK